MGLQRRTDFWHKLQLQPQRAVSVLALAVAVLLCALVARDLQRDYEQQFSAAVNKTSSLTQMLEEHARQSMRRVELALSLAAQDVQTQSLGGGRLSSASGTRLSAFLPQDGLLTSFAVINAKGQTVASTLEENLAELPTVQGSDFVRVQQDASQSGLFVGAAVRNRTTGLWIIPVSVRLEGGFDGTLVAAVDPEYFQHFYQSIDTGEDGFVTLFTTQGWAVARWPFTSEIAERNWFDSPLFQHQIPNSREATVQQKLSFNGLDSVYSYRVLPEYPLVVALGMSLDETLQHWRERAWLEVAGLALLLLSLAGATVLLRGQLRRRMLAESALQLSEISLLKSSLPTLWIGPDARILRVNQAACDLHGYSEADMLRMCVPDLNPDMPMASWAAHWQRLRDAKHLHFEATHRNRQGQDIAVEVELNFIEFDGREYNFAFFRDLTVRKRNEAEIQRNADFLRGAIDAVDEAFVLFDQDDRLVYCNAKYIELYPGLQDLLQPGTRFEDLIRAGAQRGLYRDSVGRQEAWVAERLKAHLEGHETRVQKRDDGRVLRVIDRKTPDGNIVGIRVDITDMVRATEEAQEASRTKSQFLANMSHEIRTPMNAILGLLTLLQNTELSPTQRDYASKTKGAAQFLLGLLNDILDFSKVEAGKLELDPQDFHLEQLLGDVAVILCSTIGGKNLDVLFDIDASVPLDLVGDSLRLSQVLVNLGSNAVKFTEQGQVVLRVRNVPAPEPSLSDRSWIEFSVEDSGIGIAPDQQAHIFTGFSQAEASTTRRFGGTGLGLAICKRLVERMGGSLALQSAPGQGSVFSFKLPLQTASVQVDDTTPDAAEVSKAQRVLIVDDNPIACDILSRMTRSWSWPTDTVSGGAQALDLIRGHLHSGAFPFDVIYLDWQMPQMDGWETARQIRALCPVGIRPRIVLLSANDRETLLQRTAPEQAMVDGCLYKPVMARALRDAATVPTPQALHLKPARRSTDRPLAGMRILVVEDNLINQQVAEELLRAEGAQVSLAANGQLGVDAVAASQPPFDVVLMDLQMPVLDGYDATRKIRQQLGLTQLPIVAMTANALDSDRLACLAVGMNEHVGKPFDTRQLVALLQRVTGRELAPAYTPSTPSPDSQAASRAVPDLGHLATPFNELTGPYLDAAVALGRLSGLTALYMDIAWEYLKSLDRVEDEFRQAAAQAQWPALVIQMHSLKGVSSTLGAQALSEHAASLEKLLRAPPPGLLALALLPDLLALVAATRAAVQSVLQVLAREEGEEPVPYHLPAGPAERAQAGVFLSGLLALLGANNLAVLERFAQRGHALDALPMEAVQDLQAALQSLNLERARQICGDQLQALAGD
jgi:PAS domain S-box-containing protein